MCRIGPNEDDYFDLEEKYQSLLQRLKDVGSLTPGNDESALRFAARLQRMASEGIIDMKDGQ